MTLFNRPPQRIRKALDKEKTLAYTSTRVSSSDVESCLDSFSQSSSKTSLVGSTDVLLVFLGVLPLDGETQLFQSVDSPQGCRRLFLTPFHASVIGFDMPNLMEQCEERFVALGFLPLADSPSAITVGVCSTPASGIVHHVYSPLRYLCICYLDVARHVSSVVNERFLLSYSSIIPNWVELTFETAQDFFQNIRVRWSESTIFCEHGVFA